MKLDLISVEEPICDTSDTGRFYSFGTHKYPSITTVLGATSDKSGLDAWRARVGAEEADRISKRSTTIGTELHSMMENFIYGNTFQKGSGSANAMFRSLSATLHKRANVVRAVELPLYSPTLKVAGRTDLIAEFDGELCVIDYKSNHGSSLKNPKYLIDYKLQSTFYALAFNELGYGKIKTGVLLIGNVFCCQTEKYDIIDFIPMLLERVNAYYQL